MVAKVSSYMHLLKLYYQLQFIEVIFGVLLVGSTLTAKLLFDLFLLFVSSHLMLYGGLYTINDLRDIEEDRKDEHKRHRPLPSGRIRRRDAVIFATVLISLGLTIGYFYFGLSVFLVYVALIILNILYTYVFKRIPFIELVGNVLTHPFRVILGVLVAGGVIHYPILLAYLLTTFGFTCARRQILRISKGSEHRPNMKYYTNIRMNFLEIVAFILIGIISTFDKTTNQVWYSLLLFIYFLSVFGMHFLSPVKNFFMKIYLR
ncbi:MAG: UbiA family prenyltransferase [Candidatus Levybacteria bacterium]|nr:UbiA family prenyltransferase [Candidatus Levybacteria bacterium]